MSEKQKLEAAIFLSGWLEKVSVGCLVVGLFQRDHLIGGMIGAIFFFLTGLVLKIRGTR